MQANQKTQAVIFQTADIDDKIIIKEQKGAWQQTRRWLATVLMLVFIGTPFIRFQGEQAVLFDIGAQQLRLFSMVLYPQDLLVFFYLFVIAAFLLFYVSARYGRLWCGFMCPQTIWSLLFFWMQFRIEGNYQAQKKRLNGKLSLETMVVKSVKHVSWLGIALLTSIAFMSYFTPVEVLYVDLFSGELTGLYWGWILFFMLATYINAGWVKEKMCEHMCPYSRFQSAMISEGTKVVSYIAQRGEPRAPRKINQEKPALLGDCVDCNLCVQVCPVGIDIRKGFQYQCISCGLCIDACNQVMKRFNYPQGLIKNHAEKESSHVRSIAYVRVITIFIALFAIWFASRPLFEVSVIKDRNVLFRETIDGRIENIYQFKILNKTPKSVAFNLAIQNNEQLEIISTPVFELAGLESQIAMVNVRAPIDFDSQFTPVTFELTAKDSLITVDSMFHHR